MRFIRHRAAVYLWLASLIGLAAFIAARSSNPDWLRSNIFDLLPSAQYDPNVERAVSATQQEVSRRLIVLIGHADDTIAADAARTFVAGLTAHPLIESVEGEIDASEIASVAQFYYPYRRQLLTPEQIAEIDADDGESAAASALASVYSLFGGASAQTLTTDPFALFPQSLSERQSQSGNVSLRDGFLQAAGGERDYIFLSVRARPEALAWREQAALVDHIDALTRSAIDSDPGIDVLATGYLLFADAGTRGAQKEISIIGTGSLLGIVLLMILIFRSIRPLGLAVMSLAFGCAAATAVTVLVFGSLHLFTLIFGASLIGVSIDYAFHFVCRYSFAPADEPATKSIRAILPGITLGLLSSSIAYLTLLAAPFPGLKQLAVFSASGLGGAWLTLLICGDRWARPSFKPDRTRLVRFCQWYLLAWQRFGARRGLTIASILLILAAASVTGVRVDDDISQLQSRPPGLVLQEREIRDILGEQLDTAFLLVTGSDADAVLEREASVSDRLDQLISQSSLSGYEALSRYVPSSQQQTQSARAYDELLDRRLAPFLADIGFTGASSTEMAAAIRRETATPLTLVDWLDSPLGRQLGFLWLDTIEGSAASMIQLQGATDLLLIERTFSDMPYVDVVDQRSDLSELFGSYRVRISYLLVLAYFVVLAALSVRYGLRGAIVVLIPPVTAGLVALTVISALGLAINLFNVLAVILVLGIGIDFSLFARESEGRAPSTMLAISLAATTTILSFGLLSLSATYAVRSFGLTILLGIGFAYLLSPLAGVRHDGDHAARE